MRAASVVAKSLCMAAMLMAAAVPATAQGARGAAVATQRGAHQAVYLVKGLAGFQTGFEGLGQKLLQRGVFPRLTTHGESDLTADEIIRRYRAGLRAPIILVGYSLGADAAGRIASKLYQSRVPVALLVTYGPVADVPVTPNVARAINYYQSTSMWRGRMTPTAGFRGSLRNLNLDNEPDINHFTISSAERYQLQTIANITALLGHSRRPAAPKPASQTASGHPGSTQSR